MLPVADVIPSRTTPWATIGLIAANLGSFAVLLSLPAVSRDAALFDLGAVPHALTPLTALASLFLHSGWVHLGGNLLVLWLVGDTIEDRVGHVRLLLLYLLAGLLAATVESLVHGASTSPLLGSGSAVAGVAGAYLALFPTSRMLVVIPLPFFWNVVEVPALLVIGLWLILQIFSGLSYPPVLPPQLALWPHLVGLLTGASTIWFLRRPERQRVEWWSP